MNPLRRIAITSFTLAALVLAGCMSQPFDRSAADRAAAGAPASTRWTTDAATAARILALDPDHVTDRDVRETLAKGPTPRIMLLHGGVFPVHLVMESFGEFLTGMGYPEAQIRDPGNGDWSYSPYLPTSQLAGLVAWQYEHDGLHPMLIGHSQGGLSAVKILKDLAGLNGSTLRVWNPLTGTLEERTTIVDPMTGRERPAIGVSASYASAVGAGGFALILPGWWESLNTLRQIPDTVDDFTGYFIEVDLFALSLPGNPLDRRYEASGSAHVRNMTLPATYSHVVVPATASLAQDPAVRDWVNAYVPDTPHDTSSLPAAAADHVLWAADAWYSVKRHWCLEAQRWLRAQRPRVAAESAPR
ncbi:MAG: hypothetical protein ABI533_02795 [Betaproteobacteria bacterium]